MFEELGHGKTRHSLNNINIGINVLETFGDIWRHLSRGDIWVQCNIKQRKNERNKLNPLK